MRIRLLAAGGALWAVAYLCGYGWVIGDVGGSHPAWWYVGVVSIAVLVLLAVAAGVAGKRALIFSIAVLGLSAFVGIMTIGILLIPAIVAVAIALLTSPPRTSPPVPAARMPRADS